MRTILLKVAYDGTEYCGFQRQENLPTIEEALCLAVLKITGEQVTLLGGGRTDAGVHSVGNAAVFTTESKIPAERFPMALNTALPEDIRVISAEEVPEGFHPRKCHSVKTYEYRIENGRIPTPLYRREAYFYHVPLNAEAMKEAAAYLVGEHDFSAFCSAGSAAEDHIRRIYSLEVKEERGAERNLISPENRMITIRISGNGFLYNMVRIIAGTLLEVGTGRLSPGQVRDILNERDRSKAGRMVPANGLTQIGIHFCEEEYPQSVENEDWAYHLSLEEEGRTLLISFSHLRQKEDGEVLIGKLTSHGYRDGREKVILSLADEVKEVLFSAEGFEENNSREGNSSQQNSEEEMGKSDSGRRIGFFDLVLQEGGTYRMVPWK